MNFGTIIGLIVGLALLFIAAYMGASDTGVPITSLLHGTSALIVFAIL